jgi:phage-related protein
MDIQESNSYPFDILPALGATASFTSKIDQTKYGHNHSQRMPTGINALSMNLNLNFNSLTDKQAKTLVSFLQKPFYYEPQNWNSDGSFDNVRVLPFMYDPFYPYKRAPFYCPAFKHEKQYFNVNNVSAKFEFAHPSILSNVESNVEYNEKIASKIDISKLGTSAFLTNRDGAMLSLKTSQTIFKPDTYFHYLINSSTPINVPKNGQGLIDLKTFASSSTTMTDVIIWSSINRSSMFLENPQECSYYTGKPMHEDGNLNIRMFDFRPSSSIEITHTPKYLETTASDTYRKYIKYGLNPNLLNLRLNFQGLSDKEVKNALFFLESHLGYKKFGFHLQKDYHIKPDSNSSRTPNRKPYSTFYCPEWSHTFVYKDNHNISALFVECLDY